MIVVEIDLDVVKVESTINYREIEPASLPPGGDTALKGAAPKRRPGEMQRDPTGLPGGGGVCVRACGLAKTSTVQKDCACAGPAAACRFAFPPSSRLQLSSAVVVSDEADWSPAAAWQVMDSTVIDESEDGTAAREVMGGEGGKGSRRMC